MKKIILLFFLTLLTISCTGDDSKSNSYTFRNSTSFEVIVSSNEDFLDGAPNFNFPIPAGETGTYKSENRYFLFEIKSNESDKIFNYEFQGDTRVIYNFNDKVLYKILGNATSADITYSTPQGGTGQGTVSLPYNLRFDSFPDSFYYISAQNNNEFGNITVEIYYEDNKRATDFCSGSFCIATASASYR
jgi:hypothetical protein